MRSFTYTFITLVLLAFSTSVVGQTNPLSFKTITYKVFVEPFRYVRYPDQSLGEEYKSMYAIKAVADTVPHAPMVYHDLQPILIKGFKRVDADSMADLKTEILLEGIVISKPKIRTSEYTDPKRGTVEQSAQVSMEYLINYSVRLTDMRKNVVIDQFRSNISGTWDREYRGTKGFDRLEDEINSLIAAGKEEITDKVKEEIEKIDSGTARKWSNLYGTQYVSEQAGFYGMMDKDWYETYLYRKEVKKIKTPTSWVDESIEEDESEKQPERFVAYHLSLIEKYKAAQPKVLLEITSTGYHNIAVMYMMWEDFAKAREYAKKGLTTGELKKKFEEILKSCDEREAYLKKFNITTRYGSIDNDLIQ